MIYTEKASSHVRQTKPICMYSFFVVELIMSYVGERLINQSLGKNINQMVELSCGNQNRIVVETTSGEYFFTVFCKWFISLILSMKSKFHSFELSCARGLMDCIFKTEF